MQGQNTWSYRPYRPLLTHVGDIYVCRVAPSVNAIHFEWLDIGAENYDIFFRVREQGDFIHCGSTTTTEYDVTGLEADTDYEFYVAADGKTSRIRLARCGGLAGTVVNYLHPDDKAYAYSGWAICSPTLLRHPDGYLLSTMDVFGPHHPQNLTLIFRSDDDGETWHYVSEIMPCFWGKLFIHKGGLYMMGCSTEYGDLMIGKSTDGGKTFGAPVVLLRGSNGKNGSCGVHKNPQNSMYHNGRLYETMEWGAWLNTEYYHAVMVMSCDENADIMIPENWHFSEPVKYDPNWNGVAKGEAKGNIEGTLCVGPDGQLYNIMRYNITNGDPPYGLVLRFRVNTEDPDAPLEYKDAIKLPGNNAKFIIRFDPVSGKYYTIICRIFDSQKIHARTLVSLMVSEDLEHWDLVRDIIDIRQEDPQKSGYQYASWLIEGDDIIFVSRTSMNNARNYHDTNYQTFHRIKNFRSL